MKLSIRELIANLIAAALAVGNIVFGSYEALWELVGASAEMRGALTLGLSVVILLLGHIVGAAIREAEQIKDITTRLSSFEQTLNNSMSGVSGMRVFQTSDAALSYLIDRLPNAKKVWNTRIPAPGVGDYSGDIARRYAEAVHKAVQSGVFFKEIVGPVFEARAAALSKSGDNYEYVTWDNPNAPFFNFIVVEDASGVREVIFGWVITPVHGFEQACFNSRNQSLVHTFTALHDFMMSQRLRAEAAGDH